MSEEKTEELETSQNQTEPSDSTSEETTKEDSDVDVLKKKMAEIEEKNRQLYERTKKAELKAKELEAKDLASKPQGNVSEDRSTYDPMESVKLLNALKDYSQEEIDLISQQAKAYGLSIQEAAKHEDVKLLIEAKRDKNKSDLANPTPSTRQSPTDKKFEDWTKEDITTLSRNPTKDNISKMSEYIKWAKSQG